VSTVTLRDRLSKTVDANGVFTAFVDWVSAQGLELYAAQEEAILELMGGKNVVLATPTGSGKSLVALALEAKAFVEKRRAYYTCPIKALVSEKFFALCRELGAENVGMVTGDASINAQAPVVCCTAEILSNLALREAEHAELAYVIMDEFHYYGDRDRGVAWQVPLLTLPQAQFLLMSATLGDTSVIEKSLQDLTGREVAVVKSNERPVPLEFIYSEDPLHEAIKKLVGAGRAPIYLVSFTQRDAAEQAQNLLSVDFSSREEKQRIADIVRGFRFDTPYGKDMQRFIRHGVGLHHAGLLPKYRLLVEQLAQQGALKVISGTDTLGVGVNVPIRTVLFTALAKYDGQKTGLLTVRDFKQVAGRAGRRGFDTQGTVVCQAPEHVIENKKLEARAGAGKKAVKKKPPEGFVPWDDKTFNQLIEREPEPLESRFVVSHAMLLLLLQQPTEERGGGYGRLVRIIARSHERPGMRTRHRRRARDLFRSLVAGGIVSVVRNRVKAARVVINEELQRNFSLNQTLSLYLLEALKHVDRASPTYAVEVVSLVEAILETPRIIVMKQLDRAKGERLAELKAAGMEYNERMEELEKVDYPKPLAEFLYETFDAFRVKHPWAGEDNVRPKSIAREMYEKIATFHEYVRDYGLERSEGVLLRYLSDFYRTLAQTVPDAYKDDALFEIAVYFRGMLERVDDSLVREWEQLVNPAETPVVEAPRAPRRRVFDPRQDMRGFTARVRGEMHQRVKALASRHYAAVLDIVRSCEQWSEKAIADAMAPYWAQHMKLRFDHEARLPTRTQLVAEGPRQYRVRQTLADPEGTDEWMIEAAIDLDEASDPEAPLLTLARIGT
jgi:superfamily II RNA helicase